MKRLACEAASILYKKYSNVLLNGFEKSERPVNLTHFIPLSYWSGDYSGVRDWWNGDKYWSDDKWKFALIKRIKHLLLIFATPVVHSISTVLNVANRIAKIVTFAHFRHPELNNYSLIGRFKLLIEDILIVTLSPILLVGLEISAIYGLILPYDGGKLYATIERVAFGKIGEDFLAPCLQPEPRSHFFGGNGNNGW